MIVSERTEEKNKRVKLYLNDELMIDCDDEETYDFLLLYVNCNVLTLEEVVFTNDASTTYRDITSLKNMIKYIVDLVLT